MKHSIKFEIQVPNFDFLKLHYSALIRLGLCEIHELIYQYRPCTFAVIIGEIWFGILKKFEEEEPSVPKNYTNYVALFTNKNEHIAIFRGRGESPSKNFFQIGS